MRIVVAPNSFKESLSAMDFIRVVESVADDEIIPVPLSDGGDGFLDCLPGEEIEVPTIGPLGEEIEVLVKRDGRRIYIESASVLGLRLVPPERRDPKKTTSKGLGILIRRLLGERPEEIVIGFGGSATVDFGIGALSELGIRFLGKEGPVPPNATGIGAIR
ncbi:glycerate kinase, partial [candidate division WOR-3 bacterium]